jgi:hypothetical protein
MLKTDSKRNYVAENRKPLSVSTDVLKSNTAATSVKNPPTSVIVTPSPNPPKS